MTDTSEVLTRARAAGASAGMIDPSDLDKFFDVDSLTVGPGDAIAKLREAKPYLFRPLLDPERLSEQIAEFGHKQEDDAIKKFIASKPSTEAFLRAIHTGDFRC